MSMQGPDSWFSLANELYQVVNEITPSVASRILRRFADIAVQCDFANEPWEPRALSEILHFSGAGVC